MNCVFFTDRDLGMQFPRLLAESGLTVERHGDLFQPEGSDEEWLEHCGRLHRVAITHNSRIRYVPNELAALIRFRVTLLVLVLVLVGKAPIADLAESFVRTLPRIQAMLARLQPPAIVKVYRPSPAELSRAPETAGRVELWFPKG